MGLPGLQRECLRSGAEWDATVRRFEDEAFARLGRACGRAKVLREILRHLARDVAIADVRAVSSIARRLRVTVRNVRQHLAALEAGGWIVRVHKAGLRFPGQRGWATSAYIVPALLPAVALMPPGRREKARALLRAPAIMAALLAAGRAAALQVAAGNAATSRSFSISSAERTNRKTSSRMGTAHRSIERSDPFDVTGISIVLPLPPRTRTSPRDHAAMASPPVFAAEVEARGHREEVSASGGPAPDVPPTPTARTKSGGAQGRPRHTYRPRPRPEVLAAHSARGIPPDEAARRVYAYDLVAAWRRMRSARGDPAGRKPRIRGLLRTAMREQEAMRREYEAKRLREQREGGAVPELHDSR